MVSIKNFFLSFLSKTFLLSLKCQPLFLEDWPIKINELLGYRENKIIET